MLLAYAAVVLLLGFVARLAFDRYKVPDFLVLTAAGIAAGPAALNLLPPDVLAGIVGASGPFMALTVAFVMMEAGIHLEATARRVSLALILIHTAMAIALTFVGAYLLLNSAFGFSATTATVVAAATLGPSAVVLASVAPRLGLRPETRQALIIEGVVSNVIGFFVVFSVPSVGAAPADFGMWAGALSKLALAAMLAAGVAIVWGLALRRLHPKEGVFIATLAVAVGVYALASGPLGGNGAVAAFIFGATLRWGGGVARAGAQAKDGNASAVDLGRFHSEASFLVRTFFFFYLGLIFVPGELSAPTLSLALLLVGLFIAARLPSAALLRHAWSLPRPDTLTLQGSVARGLTDILLILYGITSGLIPAREAGPIAAVAVVILFASLAANAAMIVAAERIRAREKRAEEPAPPPARTLD